MNYGPNGISNSTIVSSERLSFDVTEIAVAHFNSAVGKSGETIDRLDVGRASDITRKTATSPTSLVLALIYLERLRLVSHCTVGYCHWLLFSAESFLQNCESYTWYHDNDT